MAYALTWDSGYKNLMVATAADLAAARAACEAARATAGIAVEAPEDLLLSGGALVALYGALASTAGVEGPNPSRFATRGDGQRRVFGLLDLYFKNAAAAAPPAETSDAAAETGDTTSTETTENDVTTKGKKKAKKAAAKKSAPKKEGAKALVREDSSRGKLLRLAVENPGISLASIASRAGVSGEGSMDAKGRARMRLRVVAEAVGAAVSFEDDKVASFKLPAGMTLEKAFGR